MIKGLLRYVGKALFYSVAAIAFLSVGCLAVPFFPLMVVFFPRIDQWIRFKTTLPEGSEEGSDGEFIVPGGKYVAEHLCRALNGTKLEPDLEHFSWMFFVSHDGIKYEVRVYQFEEKKGSLAMVSSGLRTKARAETFKSLVSCVMEKLESDECFSDIRLADDCGE